MQQPITELPEEELKGASFFGRIFGRSGGLTEAVAQGIKEHGAFEFDYKPMTCNGIEECRLALMRKNKNLLPANFIEGMACVDGCVGGAGCLTHGEKNGAALDAYGKEALSEVETITEAVEKVLSDKC